MSANTLTNLISTIYEALDTVAREPIGAIQSVFRNSSAERAAKDQTVRYPVVPAMSTTAISAAATTPDPSGITVGSDTLTIDQAYAVRFPWNGEEEKGMTNSGIYQSVLRDEFSQGFRAIANQVESDICEKYVAASRAYGTAGTPPFGSTYAEMPQIKKILDDNGCPAGDRFCVINTTAGAALRTLAKMQDVNTAGTDSLQRTGELLNLMGFSIRESSQVQTHTAGSGSSYEVNLLAGYDIGSTSIAADQGSGTILAGDILTNSQSGRDANKYVVKTALTAGTLVLANPGIRKAWVNNDTLAVGAAYTANLFGHRSAIHLVTRVPAVPSMGDLADDATIVTDPISGLSFEVRVYKQYRQVTYEIALAWGVKVVKPEFLGILLG